MKSVTLLVVEINTKLSKYLIQSFEKFKPKDLNVNYLVVENSPNNKFKDEICAISDNITWLDNPPTQNWAGGSSDHCRGLTHGRDFIKDEWVFICDNDSVVTSESFFSEFFKKAEEGFDCMAVSHHPDHDTAHLSGGFFKTELVKKVDLYPFYNGNKFHDTGSGLTFKSEKHYIFRNTWNDNSLVDIINDPYKSWGETCGIDRCLDSNNNIMHIHLGRGVLKYRGGYTKPNKRTYSDWIEFIEKELL